MHDEERLAERRQMLFLGLISGLLDKFPTHPKHPTGDSHIGLARRLDRGDAIAQLSEDMLGVEWRPDCHNGFRFRNSACRGDYRSAAEAMADKNRWCCNPFPQRISRCYKIRNIGGKSAVRELALAAAKAGKIKSQHRYAMLGQRR
jgi:hypothetical protein